MGVGSQGHPVKMRLMEDFCGRIRNAGATAFGDREERAWLLPASTFQLPTAGFPLTEPSSGHVLQGPGEGCPQGQPPGSQQSGARAGGGHAGKGARDAREAHPLPALSPEVSEQTHGPGHRSRLQEKCLASWKRCHGYRTPGSRFVKFAKQMQTCFSRQCHNIRGTRLHSAGK